MELKNNMILLNNRLSPIIGNNVRETYNEEERPTYDFIVSKIGYNKFQKSSGKNKLFERILNNLVKFAFVYNQIVETHLNRDLAIKLLRSKSSTRYENGYDIHIPRLNRDLKTMIQCLEYIIENYIYLIKNNLVVDYAIPIIEKQITLLYKTMNILTPPDKEGVYLGSTNVNQTNRSKTRKTNNGRNNGRKNRRKNGSKTSGKVKSLPPHQ